MNTEKLQTPEILRQKMTVEDLSLILMPLSGVTHKYGEEGLLKRFVLETRHFDEDGRGLCNQAVAIAHTLFIDEEYKGMPYMTHLLRVATRLIRDYDIYEPEVIAAAILHDSIEDFPDDIVTLLGRPGGSPYDALASSVGDRVAGFVQELSNEPKPPGLSAEEKNQMYLKGVRKKLASSFEVFIIKLSDFTDNAVGLHWGVDPIKTPRLARKYGPVFDVFLEAVAMYENSGQLQPQHAELARKKLQNGKLKVQSYIEITS